MIISIGKSRKDTRWRCTDMAWDELVRKLGSFFRTHETAREYKAMTKEEQSQAKDIGGFVGGRIEGGNRKNENVRDRCLVTLDADAAEPDTWDDVELMWENALCCYSTHSSTPEHPRLRFVIPLKRAVTAEEYPAIARKLAQRIGIDMMDPTTYEAARLMYWPSCSRDADPFFREIDGGFIDPDAVLAEYGLGEAWKDTTLWPIGKMEQEVRTKEAKRQGDPREKPGIVGLFCRTYDVHDAIAAFLPEVYTEAGENRYTYVDGSTAAGAVVYQDGDFLYSHHGTDPISGQLCNAFDLVRIHLFRDLDAGQENQEITRRPSYQKMCELAAEDPKVRSTRAKESMDSLSDLFEGDGDEADLAWTEKLEVNKKTGQADQTINNAVLILRHDPHLSGAFAVNMLKARPVVRKPVPWRGGETVKDERNGDPWTDADNAGLRHYMETTWHFKGRAELQDAFDIVSEQRAFNPVQDYLRGLEWDGVERLDTMLIRWMRAKDTPYVRAATRKWMTAAVKRAMQPGCKFDQMLVLIGKQGIGKSNLARVISRGWFTDSLGRLDASKDTYERLSGVWIAEIAELAAAKKAEVEDIKNFISKTEDTFRRAYQRETGTYPRQCVFYGTTNDPEFLRDKTGARRFWPVVVSGFDRGQLKGLEDEVDQLWAEAVYRWKQGEVLFMDNDALAAAAAEEQDQHSVHDDLELPIRDYLDAPRPENWYELTPEDRAGYFSGLHDLPEEGLQVGRVSTAELRNELLGNGKPGAKDPISYQISAIMNNMPGWRKCRKPYKLKGYGTVRGWCREGSEYDEGD